MVKIQLRSNYGDRYYIGLNGLQLFDELGHRINVVPDQIQAVPFRSFCLHPADVFRCLCSDVFQCS